jgi:hypothetical protein
MKCIVCQSEDLFVNFTHTYWKKPVHTCKKCDHTHLYDYDNVDEKDYSVNKHRAGKYLKMLENIPVESVLEIGPASNFWFSKQFCDLTFEHIDCKVIKRASGVHSGGNPFVAYRLPEGYDIQ